VGKQSTPISLHCDSQAATKLHTTICITEKRDISLSDNGAVKQLLKHGVISLKHVRSKKNLTDLLTKGLPRKVILESLRGMGLKPIK